MRRAPVLFLLVTACSRPHVERFRGTVEAIDTGCYVDATCTLTISGRRVVFGRGWSRSDWGEVVGLDPSNSDAILGREVEVYARKYDDLGYTLEGDDAYYVRPVPQ